MNLKFLSFDEVKNTTDESSLFEIAILHKNLHIRKLAIKKISDEFLLYLIAMYNKAWWLKIEAIKKIHVRSCLLALQENEKDERVLCVIKKSINKSP